MSQLVALELGRETSVQVQNRCAGAQSARFCTPATLHRAEAHTHTDDWRYRPRLCTAGILSHSAVADLERGGEGGLVLLLVGRRCVGGLRRDGQALAYKGERETVL